MKVIVTNSYDESCAVVAGMIRDLVNAKPNAKLGLATGGTPVPIYQKLAQMNQAGEVDFSQVHTVNLDEYCGLPGTHEQSYRYFYGHQPVQPHQHQQSQHPLWPAAWGTPRPTPPSWRPRCARAARPICSCWHWQQRPHCVQRGQRRPPCGRGPHRKADAEHH